MTTDIRDKDIILKVGLDECSDAAIDRYMARKGFKVELFTDGKGLEHKYYYSSDYYRLWVGCHNYIDDITVRFQLVGDR
jgi:hypothetical protein